jgi:hypothetical protein
LVPLGREAGEPFTPNADLVGELDTILGVGMREIICRGREPFRMRALVELDTQLQYAGIDKDCSKRNIPNHPKTEQHHP